MKCNSLILKAVVRKMLKKRISWFKYNYKLSYNMFETGRVNGKNTVLRYAKQILSLTLH